jgi:hypothetical protein
MAKLTLVACLVCRTSQLKQQTAAYQCIDAGMLLKPASTSAAAPPLLCFLRTPLPQPLLKCNLTSPPVRATITATPSLRT